MRDSKEAWDTAFDTVLNYIKAEKAALPEPSLIQTSEYMQPVEIKTQARAEVLGLFETALETLKADRISGERGDIALASERVSLRNAQIAKSLGTKAPKYQRDPDKKLTRLGADLAYNYMDILLDTATNDRVTSHSKLLEAFEVARHRDKIEADLSAQEDAIIRELLKDKAPDHNRFRVDSLHQQMSMMIMRLVSESESVQRGIKDKIESISPAQGRLAFQQNWTGGSPKNNRPKF